MTTDELLAEHRIDVSWGNDKVTVESPGWLYETARYSGTDAHTKADQLAALRKAVDALVARMSKDKT